MFINVAAIDQYLLNEPFAYQNWHVHSIYKNSFNLQNEGKKELVVVTTTDYPFLPNGIYLNRNDFFNIRATIKMGESLLWGKERLSFSDHHLILTHGETYTSEIEHSGEWMESAMEYFTLYCKKLKKETGFQRSLTELIEVENPFMHAISMLSSEQIEEQRRGVAFLLGRGPGLTPTGDDMLLGHLAAMTLLKKNSKNVKLLLHEELRATTSPTTDVSLHYLKCGIVGRFSRPVKDLMQLLVEECSQEQMKLGVEAVINFGHTSGIDLLAGFLGTVAYFRGK